jgi:DNA-binding protein HU-beta
MVTKAQFVEQLKAALPDVFPTKAAAEKAYDAFCEVLAKNVAAGGVRLPDVGGFTVVKRAKRSGRNPRTGQAITIPARKVVKFSPSKALGESVNKKK